MKFSVTDIENFKRCRRKWHLTSISDNRLGLEPMMSESVALDLGTLFHKTMADWITDFSLDPSFLFLGHANTRMTECIANYTAIVGCAPSDEELDKLFEAIDLGKTMVENYKNYHKIPLPKHMTYKAPEQAVEILMPGTEHDCEVCYGRGNYQQTIINPDGSIASSIEIICETCNGTGIVYHYLTCTFDGLLQDMRDNVYVLEHKTYATTPNINVLKRTDQFCGYLWVANQVGKELGWKVAGLAYDGVLKRKTPPRGKTVDDMFIRKVLDRSDTAMEHWQTQAAQCMNEMAVMPTDIYDGVLYPHIPFQGCWDCKVKKICDAVDEGEDWQYIAKTGYVRRKVQVGTGPV